MTHWRRKQAQPAPYAPSRLKTWHAFTFLIIAAIFTADAKNESDMAINEHAAGHRTLKRICADNADFWEAVQDQLIAERARLERRCKEEGIDPDKIVKLPPSANPAPKNATGGSGEASGEQKQPANA